jgi:spore germination cell wall hydrolase CwlJ-like protein
MPIEAVVVPRGYFSHDVGSEAVRPYYAVLSDWDVAAGENRCLAEATYFEARGQSEESQAAVAQVVLNRVSSGLYPPTICSVVSQNRRHFNACQFSFACRGNPLRTTEPDAWREAQKIAAEVTRGGTYLSAGNRRCDSFSRQLRPAALGETT